MGRQKKLSFWDWRPWVSVICIITLFFWLKFGFYYYEAKAGLLPFDIQEQGLIAKYIGLEAIESHFFAWVFAFTASMAVIIYLALRSVNSLINYHSIKNTADDLLLRIPACTDDEIATYNAQLGITVTSHDIVIPLSILNYASVESLARDLCVLFYLVYDDIKYLTERGECTALHGLADLLLDNWSDNRIARFIEALLEEKDYIARLLDFALKRRSLDRQIAQLAQKSETCREQEKSVVEILKESRSLGGRFIYYNELLSGKSAVVKWLKSWLSRFSPRRFIRLSFSH